MTRYYAGLQRPVQAMAGAAVSLVAIHEQVLSVPTTFACIPSIALPVYSEIRRVWQIGSNMSVKLAAIQALYSCRLLLFYRPFICETYTIMS